VIRAFGLPESLVSQLCATLNTLFVVPVNRLAASEAVFTLRQLMLGGAGRYHLGGYGRVAEVCADYVTEHGGRFLTNQRVRRIVVERGRAVGIETDAGVLHARTVVSNAGIQPTVLRLAGRTHFPSAYVERVETLEPSWAIAGIRYVLDAPVFDAALIPIYSDQSWLDDDRFARMQSGDWPDVPLIAIACRRRSIPPGLRPRPPGVEHAGVLLGRPDVTDGRRGDRPGRGGARRVVARPARARRAQRTLRRTPHLGDESRFRAAGPGRRGGRPRAGRRTGRQGQTRPAHAAPRPVSSVVMAVAEPVRTRRSTRANVAAIVDGDLG
jgi:hypothetical protein